MFSILIEMCMTNKVYNISSILNNSADLNQTLLIEDAAAGQLPDACKRPAAIVSPIPGTTRDVVQTHLDINGFPLNIADTAGLRENPADPVEAEGISRAILCADASDLLVFILDATLLIEWAMTRNMKAITWKEFKIYFKAWIKSLGIEAQIMQCDNLKDIIESKDITTHRNSQGMIILNKVDLISSTIIDSNIRDSSFVCEVSCKTEYGIENLLKKTTTKLEDLCGDPKRAQVGFSKPYQRYCLEECLSCLNRYIEMESLQTPADLCAEELRKAMNCIGRLTGKVSAEQLLDVIFRDFCIGK